MQRNLSVMDKDGYRANVGMIVVNHHNQVWWGRQAYHHSWQFPQGGIQPREDIETAMYRELNEEIGLHPDQVHIIARTRHWLRYDVPDNFRNVKTTFRGQKQIWYLLRFNGMSNDINIRSSEKPEFDAWLWSDFWHPLNNIIAFKRDVYASAMQELFPNLSPR